MQGLKLVAICGSLRTASFNRKLLAHAVKEAERLGCEVDLVDLRALAIPVYDGDEEEGSGPPPSVVDLKNRIRSAAGMLIASPEYNHSIPGGLKNALDWASRAPDPPFRGKWALIMGASPGPVGTARGQPHLRQTLNSVGVWTVPSQMLVPHQAQAFDAAGALRDPMKVKELNDLVAHLVAELDLRARPQ